MQDCFDDIAKFKAVLADRGVPGALAFLNRRAPHRYAAIYKLDGDVMLNVGIHDRLGQVASPLPPTPRVTIRFVVMCRPARPLSARMS